MLVQVCHRYSVSVTLTLGLEMPVLSLSLTVVYVVCIYLPLSHFLSLWHFASHCAFFTSHRGWVEQANWCLDLGYPCLVTKLLMTNSVQKH